MDSQTPEFLPWLADRLRDWFPELEGRALAVSWGEIEPDYKPTLPIAFVSPGRQTFSQPNSGRRLNVIERFEVEFWLSPKRYKDGKGAETPFWSYYDFNRFRDRLFAHIAGERTPGNGAIRLTQMDVEADPLALIIAFSGQAEYDTCIDEGPELDECGNPKPQTDGLPVAITFTLGTPAGNCAPPKPTIEDEPCP